MKFLGSNRWLIFLRRRGVTILLVVVYLASAWLLGQAMLLVIDQPLSADQIRSQQEPIDTSALNKLKTLIKTLEDQSQQPPDISRDPF